MRCSTEWTLLSYIYCCCSWSLMIVRYKSISLPDIAYPSLMNCSGYWRSTGLNNKRRTSVTSTLFLLAQIFQKWSAWHLVIFPLREAPITDGKLFKETSDLINDTYAFESCLTIWLTVNFTAPTFLSNILVPPLASVYNSYISLNQLSNDIKPNINVLILAITLSHRAENISENFSARLIRCQHHFNYLCWRKWLIITLDTILRPLSVYSSSSHFCK